MCRAVIYPLQYSLVPSNTVVVVVVVEFSNALWFAEEVSASVRQGVLLPISKLLYYLSNEQPLASDTELFEAVARPYLTQHARQVRQFMSRVCVCAAALLLRFAALTCAQTFSDTLKVQRLNPPQNELDESYELLFEY